MGGASFRNSKLTPSPLPPFSFENMATGVVIFSALLSLRFFHKVVTEFIPRVRYSFPLIQPN